MLEAHNIITEQKDKYSKSYQVINKPLILGTVTLISYYERTVMMFPGVPLQSRAINPGKAVHHNRENVVKEVHSPSGYKWEREETNMPQ